MLKQKNCPMTHVCTTAVLWGILTIAAAQSAFAGAPQTYRAMEKTVRSSAFSHECDQNQDGVFDAPEFELFFRSNFDRDDLDSDGSISPIEIGIEGALPDPEDMAALSPTPEWDLQDFRVMAFLMRDLNRDGLIGWHEERQSVQSGFEQIDTDGNGEIALAEVTPAYGVCVKPARQVAQFAAFQ